MNLPEDRHPLLYVYLDNEQPERVRSRCVSQGATTLLGKWPEHLTFSWMMGVFGLISLLTCFLLAVILLLVSSSSHHHGKRALIEKCERNEHVIQLVHMKNLEDLTVNENATYFVEIFTNETNSKDSACSVESFLKHTSQPVFLVSIFHNTPQNITIYNELEKKFRNFKTIIFDLHSFFNKTMFANFQTQNSKFLTFLAKILVSWNVGGTVIDTEVITLKDVQSFLSATDKTLIVGTLDENVLLISAKRFCHVYIFDVLKTIIENQDILKYSEYDIIKTAQKRFCHGRWNCSALKLISYPEFCPREKLHEDCIFLLPKSNETYPLRFGNFSWKNICPFVRTLV